MNRFVKTTASAMLLTLMAATPAWAIAYDGADPAPADPGVIRILAAPADQPVPISAPLERPVLATRAEPVSILIKNSAITYDQKPLVVEGTLMVPLRAVVEGAGGEVAWDGETRTVTARLGDRDAVFVIGAGKAEVNRSAIPMAKAPLLAGGRTLVPADALTTVLGLMEQPGAPDKLNLVPAPRSVEPAPPAEEQEWVIEGSVKELKGNPDGTSSILVEGTSLTWFAVTDSTAITVAENGVQRSGTAADLGAGQQVEVRPVGPLLLSYPARGGAAAILIHK